MIQTSDDLPNTVQGRMARMVTAAQALLASGVSRGRALTYVAMSAIETNDLILIRRTSQVVFPATDSCFPICIRCAMEADFNSQAGIDLQQEGIVIDPAWYQDTTGMQILQASLNVKQSSNPNYYVHPIDYTTEWNQQNQIAFEYALVNGKYNLLKQWDMGPMFLRCTGMGPVAAALGLKQVAGFPTTAQEMFDLYVSSDYPTAFSKGAAWYDSPYYTGQMPGDHLSDTTLAANFCGRQLGADPSSTQAQNYASQLLTIMNILNSNV